MIKHIKKLLSRKQQTVPEEEYNKHVHGKVEQRNVDVAPTEEFLSFLKNQGLYLEEEIRAEINKLFPKKAHEHDAGYDIKAFITETNDQGENIVVINPGEGKIIKSGFRWKIPPGYVGQVCSRSGLAAKYAIFVLNAPGIIDSGYSGDVSTIIFNSGKQPIAFKHGDKISQLVLVKLADLEPHYVFDLDQGPITNAIEFVKNESKHRGDNGFGSTGQ